MSPAEVVGWLLAAFLLAPICAALLCGPGAYRDEDGES